MHAHPAMTISPFTANTQKECPNSWHEWQYICERNISSPLWTYITDLINKIAEIFKRHVKWPISLLKCHCFSPVVHHLVHSTEPQGCARHCRLGKATHLLIADCGCAQGPNIETKQLQALSSVTGVSGNIWPVGLIKHHQDSRTNKPLSLYKHMHYAEFN